MKVKKIRNFDHEFNELEDSVKQLKKDYSEYKKNTVNFLKECGKFGIKLVSVGKKTEKIECSSSFPFETNNSVFAYGDVQYQNYPAIWTALNNLKISGGCGNGHQHELNDTAKLIEGVYELKNEIWKQVE